MHIAFAGRVALVTGAAQGIGQAIAKTLQASGGRVHVADLDADRLTAFRKKLMTDAGYPNGFKLAFSFTQDRLPGDRQVGTSIAQMLAAIGIDAQANAQPAAVFFPARTRGDLSMSMSGLGHADRRGALHAFLARALQRQGQEIRRVQCARLQERRDGQADPGRRDRDG